MEKLLRSKKVFIAVGLVVASFVGADEVPQMESAEEVTSEQLEETDVVKNRGKGGRVIEYGVKTESSSGVVPAVVQEDPLKVASEKTPQKKDLKMNQNNSVKLITGGDPSDGNAKSGHLPILD